MGSGELPTHNANSHHGSQPDFYGDAICLLCIGNAVHALLPALVFTIRCLWIPGGGQWYRRTGAARFRNRSQLLEWLEHARTVKDPGLQSLLADAFLLPYRHDPRFAKHADPAAREASLAASERVVEQLGGALERTLAALEPYLLQLRLEMGAANA